MTSPIAPLHPQAEQDARARQAQLIKPAGALGQLEDIACWFAARQGKAIPDLLMPGITVFAADHGVATQGVSAYPQSVTVEMLSALAKQQAGIAVLARSLQAHYQARYQIVDVGVKVAADRILPNNIDVQRIASGTADLSVAPAMTLAQALQAMAIGERQADQHIDAGCNVLIAGEVGIGNTTAAACLICAHTGIKPELIVGMGTGMDAAGVARKLQVVHTALQRVINQRAGMRLLLELGGFEIAAMCGFYLQAARRGVPVVLDGFIATAAALCAVALASDSRHWMLAAHQSAERGHALALEHLQLKPLLNLGLRLGEGSGAAVAIPLIQQALLLHRDMATFSEAMVSDKS